MSIHSDIHPRVLTRTAGALYLTIIILGFLNEVLVRGGTIVTGDAAATAANLRSMEAMWRAGIAAHLFYLACAVTLALILFVLLRPVNRELALLAFSFNLVSIAIEAAMTMFLIVALLPVGGARYLEHFSQEQLEALTMLAVRSYSYGFGVSLIFFGFECLILGYLIARSGYLPRSLGVLTGLAGGSYLVNSFTLIAAPALASRLFPAILLPALVGELTLCLWLLFRGVDLTRWKPPPPGHPAAEIAAATQ